MFGGVWTSYDRHRHDRIWFYVQTSYGIPSSNWWHTELMISSFAGSCNAIISKSSSLLLENCTLLSARRALIVPCVSVIIFYTEHRDDNKRCQIDVLCTEYTSVYVVCIWLFLYPKAQKKLIISFSGQYFSKISAGFILSLFHMWMRFFVFFSCQKGDEVCFFTMSPFFSHTQWVSVTIAIRLCPSSSSSLSLSSLSLLSAWTF